MSWRVYIIKTGHFRALNFLDSINRLEQHFKCDPITLNAPWIVFIMMFIKTHEAASMKITDYIEDDTESNI